MAESEVDTAKMGGSVQRHPRREEEEENRRDNGETSRGTLYL